MAPVTHLALGVNLAVEVELSVKDDKRGMLFYSLTNQPQITPTEPGKSYLMLSVYRNNALSAVVPV